MKGRFGDILETKRKKKVKKTYHMDVGPTQNSSGLYS